MVVSCILRQAQYRIPALALVDSGASAYAFIDKSFAQRHDLPLRPLTFSRRLRGFDGQPALTGDITHVAETTLVLGNHIERLFLYVTGLNQYPIVLGLPWLRRHAIDANFGSNTLTFSSPFCLKHCCHSPVTVSGNTREEEAFLSPEESQRVWELEDQETKSPTDDINLVNIQPAQKEQPRIQSVQKEQPSRQLVQKEQSRIQSARKEQPSPSDVQEEHPDTQPSLEEDPSSRILQAIQKGYSPKIKYRSPASRRTSTERRAHQAERQRPPIQLNVAELGARGFDRATRVKGSEVFSISLRELDAFLGISDPASFKFSSHVQSPSIPRLDQKILPLVPDTRPRTYVEDHRRALHRMDKEIHLAATVNQEDLEAYRQRKNVDPATLLPKLYTAFLDCFSRKEADTLPKHGPYDHAIHLKEGASAPASALYGMSRDEALELRRYLDENLSKGFIRASRSDAAAPVLFAKKPGGGLRFCVDYRGLNAVTVKNRYPLPLISETLNRLS